MTKPEDILSNEENTKILNGVSIRKGTIAAFLQNISMIEQPECSEEQKQVALSIIRELAPAVIATGLYKHAVFKNPIIQEILDATNGKHTRR